MTAARVVASAGRRGNRAGIGCLIAMLILVGTGVCPADIRNPSFELGTSWMGGRPVPLDWRPTDYLLCFNSSVYPTGNTEGTYSAGLYSRINADITAGRFQSFWQDGVDLTGVSSIEFDVQLVAKPDGGEFANFEASFRIHKINYDSASSYDVVVWSETVGGEYRNRRVNVAGLTGHHRIEIRITALKSGRFERAHWTFWDNLRLVKGPATIPAMVTLNPDTLTTLEPGTLNLDSEGKWITCYIKLAEGYEVGAIDGATVKLNDGIPAHMGEEGWATPEANEGNVADFDGDGILERMVKFERAAVQATVEPPQATVTVQGRLTDGTPFEGSATIRVLDKGANGKKK